MTVRTKLWLSCDACDHTWPAAQLPIEVSDMVKEVRKIKACPSCGAKKGAVKLACEAAIQAALREDIDGGYVIIYDVGPADTPKEEYYGYFSSVAECKKVWRDFVAGKWDLAPRNPRICKVVAQLVPDEWKEPASPKAKQDEVPSLWMHTLKAIKAGEPHDRVFAVVGRDQDEYLIAWKCTEVEGKKGYVKHPAFKNPIKVTSKSMFIKRGTNGSEPTAVFRPDSGYVKLEQKKSRRVGPW